MWRSMGKGKTRDEESGRKVGGEAERGGKEAGKKEAGEKLRKVREKRRAAWGKLGERETGPRVPGWKKGSGAGAKREPQWKRGKSTARGGAGRRVGKEKEAEKRRGKGRGCGAWRIWNGA